MKKTLLVTHPDDELVNMYSFFIEATDLILITHNKRVNQFKKLCQDFDKEYHILNFEDGYLLSYDRDFIMSEIMQALLYIGETSFIVPSMYDTHPEHLLVSALGTKLALMLKVPLVYVTSTRKENKLAYVPDKEDIIEKYYGKLNLVNYPLDSETFTIIGELNG